MPEMRDMSQMTDRSTTDRQYASTGRLETRRGVWGPGPEGVSPTDLLRAAVVSSGSGRILEAPHTGAGVRTVPVRSTEYYGARRYLN